MSTRLYTKDVYVNYNFNKSEIKNFLIHNSDYDNIPTPASGQDKGLLYYDTILDRILVWNGECWKIVKYLDDTDYTSRENIYMNDIWMQSDVIPTTLAEANTSTIVQKITTLNNTTHQLKSYSFMINDWADWVEPDRFGSIYDVKVYAANGSLIPSDFAGMKIEGGRINFYKGFKDPNYPGLLVGPLNPPSVQWWKYVGIKGSFTFIGGSTNILEIVPGEPSGSAGPYNELVTPPGISDTNVISVTVNGVLIYDYEVLSINDINYLVMDETELGYEIEGLTASIPLEEQCPDTIRIEYNQSST